MSNSLSNYHRKGFGLKDAIQSSLQNDYDSGLVDQIRANGGKLQIGELFIILAKAFGFCWGVDRAVSMAYETRKYFPNKQIWITNEIIHNPVVNANLKAMDIKFIDLNKDGSKNFSPIQKGDVVILPAFGASITELDLLKERDCEIVDTTCPWVSRVWNRVSKYEQSDFTALIHGKYNHEETIATASRAKTYLIVQNMDEARWVCQYIQNKHEKAEFMEKFKKAYSKDFNPDLHLQKIGIANQTTMLKGETEQIGKLFEKTLLEKWGPQNIDEHFLSPGDTICDATQERQDAMLELVQEDLDLSLVIGGYNSSNTSHLQEIAVHHELKSFHIDGPQALQEKSVQHRDIDSGKLVETENWLPQGRLTIGITAGASTPDQVIAAVIEKLSALKNGSSN